MAGANDDMQLSSQGRIALRLREGSIPRYYNDIANNCTFGVGSFIHSGPCTTEELNRPVSDSQIDSQLLAGITRAEQAVKSRITDRRLTQEQFDAAVSYAFNMGANGAAAAFGALNAGNNDQARREMESSVYIHPRDRNGRRGPPRRSLGLINRRRDEMVPFR